MNNTVNSPLNAEQALELNREFSVGRLRRLRKSDLQHFQRYRNDPIVGRFQGWQPMPSDKALSFLDEMESCHLFQSGTWTQLGISTLETDALIGDMGIYIEEDSIGAQIGFTLSAENQGKGIAYAAVRELLKLLFESTKVETISAISDSRNIKCLALLERLGFDYKHSREIEFRGEICLEKIFEILKKQ